MEVCCFRLNAILLIISKCDFWLRKTLKLYIFVCLFSQDSVVLVCFIFCFPRSKMMGTKWPTTASASPSFLLRITGILFFEDVVHFVFCLLIPFPFQSDQMGNKGAFITLKEDIKPVFTTFEAVVSDGLFFNLFINSFYLILILFTQPHPNVKPMKYASMFSSGLFGI